MLRGVPGCSFDAGLVLQPVLPEIVTVRDLAQSVRPSPRHIAPVADQDIRGVTVALAGGGVIRDRDRLFLKRIDFGIARQQQLDILLSSRLKADEASVCAAGQSTGDVAVVFGDDTRYHENRSVLNVFVRSRSFFQRICMKYCIYLPRLLSGFFASYGFCVVRFASTSVESHLAGA